MAGRAGAIAVVVPSNRPGQLREFRAAWQPLFDRHRVEYFEVSDGDDPSVTWVGQRHQPVLRSQCPRAWQELACDHTDQVRALGFLFALMELKADLTTVVTLDDDVRPWEGNDPIGEHLAVLNTRVPTSWFSAGSEFTRGFPYGVREESEVLVSHGVWRGVADYDACTQLVRGNRPMTFYRGPVPAGPYFPVSGMNLAFDIKALPHLYFAPTGPRHGVHRFADIWAGVKLKRWLDASGHALATGYSTAYHGRASDVFANLGREALGLKWNEGWWRPGGESGNPYFVEYDRLTALWRETVEGMTGATSC